MANRIKIRHGGGIPSVENLNADPPVHGLLPYELGWVSNTNTKALYINDNGTIKEAALPITGGTLTGSLYIGSDTTVNSGAKIFWPNKNTENATRKIWAGFANDANIWYLYDYTSNASIIRSVPNDTNYFYGTATTISSTLPIGKGGTGATSAGSAANNLISGLPTWTANPNDDTYFIRQDTGGSDAFGRVKASTIYNYIKEKTDTLYLPLTGGTLTGNLTISGTGLGIYAYDTQSKAKIGLIVGSGHQNHGIYSYGYSPTTTTFTSDTKWLLYRGPDGNTFIPGALYIGTATDSLSKIYAARARLTATTDASGTAANNVALIIGSETGSHLEFDNNEILMKNDGTTPGTLYLQDSTGLVDIAGSEGLKISKGPLTVSGATTANGNITIEKTTPILTIKNTASSVNVSAYFEIVSSGNHGIYSSGYVGNSSAKWVIYRKGSDGLVYIPWGISGNVVLSDTCKRIFTATSATKPSAAVAGDIVLVKV